MDSGNPVALSHIDSPKLRHNAEKPEDQITYFKLELKRDVQQSKYISQLSLLLEASQRVH